MKMIGFRLTLKSGETIYVEATEVVHDSRHISWKTPPGASLSLVHVNYDEIAAVVAVMTKDVTK